MAQSDNNVLGRLPKDADNNPIQALAPGTIANAAVGAGSSALALPAGAEVVEVGASTDCWLVFGTSGVTSSNSTGLFMPKGAVVWRVPLGATHVAHIQDSASGRISVTKLD